MKLKLALICFTLAYAAWPWLWEGFFYQAIATAFIFLWWHVKPSGPVGAVGFWFSVNALVDEILFDPTQINVNEYFFGIIVIFIIWAHHHRKRIGSLRST